MEKEMNSSSDAERSRVRHRWLVQISGHTGKNERGKWGGGGWLAG
jgi:hypothetical protein